MSLSVLTFITYNAFSVVLVSLKKKYWAHPSRLILQPTSALPTTVCKMLFLIILQSPETEGPGEPPSLWPH